MQYNTALGFFLGGLGLIALTFKNALPALFLGLGCLLLGGITLIQYIFGINLGLDEFFIKAYVTVKTTHPGRMAPNTALCFSLMGFILLTDHRNRILQTSLAISIIVLSLLALFAYLNNVEGLYGWGNLTRMAIHTASCFIILGIGTLFLSFSSQGKKRHVLWNMAPQVLSSVVLVLSLLSWYGIKEASDIRNAEHFSHLVDETNDALFKRFSLYQQSLLGGVGLFHASNSVERLEWRAYVNALDIENTLPGIAGIGYIAPVKAENLEEFLIAIRQDFAPDFKNYPKTQNEEKFVIIYIEPESFNAKALGLDISFETNRRTAANKARDSGTPALTQKIVLVQDGQQTPGFLLLVPVYYGDIPPKTLEARRNDFQGWVYAPFIATDFMRGLTDITDEQLGFDVYDGDQISEEFLIYNSASERADKKTYAQQTTLELAGQKWTINWYSTSKFIPISHQYLSLFVLVFGIIFAALLYLTLLRLLQSREIIAKEVDRQTKRLLKSEERLQQANAELEEFAYRTSHDLRSPLVSSISLLSIAEKAINKGDTDKAIGSLAHTRNSLVKLETLVKDILMLTQSKNIEEEPIDVNLDSILTETLDKLQHMDNFDRLKFNRDFNFTDTFKVKKTRFILIVENLISNAIKYQDVTQNPSWVKISTNKVDQNFVLRVEDNGLGIPKDQQQNLFKMFRRFHPRTSFGSGLGLYMMNKSVNILGGDIAFMDSEKGSIFEVTIPLS
jgi:CHASE1-domain containing sensor protein/two-component sensor histidine kinase